jgi:hypothetical protein
VTRTDTATLIKACRALGADCDTANLASITIRFSDDIKSDQAFQNSVLSQIADRLEEQEATIRHLRAELVERTSAAANHVAEIRDLKKKNVELECSLEREISFGWDRCRDI